MISWSRMLQKLAFLSMEGERSLMRILPHMISKLLELTLYVSFCYICPFFSYTEVDPAVIAGDGVEMFKNEVTMKMS